MQAGTTARIVVIGQAPGRRVLESGPPWDDPSGDRLRQWLGLTCDEFYDPETVGLVPMGSCSPGCGPSGDKPPRPECAPLWHQQLLAHLPVDRLEIVIGAHAQARDIARRGDSLSETVASWRTYLPRRVVLPHPSPRNKRWLGRNPWSSSETLPSVRARVQQVLAD